jgi:membrane protease YdiL (CAAX protease family)
MRATALFFLYMLACLTLAALLTWPLMSPGWLTLEPERLMGRLAQVAMLAGLWWLLRWQRLADRRSLGLGVGTPRLLGTAAAGWLLGVAMLALLVAALLLLGVRVPETWGPEMAASLAQKAVSALIGGLLIGLLEELFFRGALFTAIRRRGGLASAAVWSSLLYAAVHFMKPHGLPADIAYGWAANWQIFASTFTGLLRWEHLDSLVALFLAGILLALLRERSGHIGWCIGLHAGWVFVIQVTRRATDGDDQAALAFLAGGYDGVIGWLGAAWIGLIIWLWWRRRAPAQPA